MRNILPLVNTSLEPYLDDYLINGKEGQTFRLTHQNYYMIEGKKVKFEPFCNFCNEKPERNDYRIGDIFLKIESGFIFFYCQKHISGSGFIKNKDKQLRLF